MRNLSTDCPPHSLSSAENGTRLLTERTALHSRCAEPIAVCGRIDILDRGSLPRDLLSTEPFIGPARHLAWGHRGRYLGRILFYTASHFSPRVLAQDSPSPEEPEGDDLYEVRIMDNDYNTYQQVMEITMLALGISQEEAFSVAWEVDHRGSCVVAVGALPEAEALAGLIRTIGIEVQVNPLIGGNA